MNQIQVSILVLFMVSTVNFSCHGQNSLDEIIKSYDTFNERNDDKNDISWSIMTEELITEDLNFYKEKVKELKAINVSSLNEEDLINLEMLQLIIEDKVFNLEYESYLMPLSSEGGFIISMMYNVGGKKLSDQDEIDNYIKKLNTTSRYVDQQIRLLKKGLRLNKKRPQLVVENCIQLLDNILKDDVLFLLKPLEGKHSLDPHYEAELYKVFVRLKSFLKDEYFPSAHPKIGIKENTEGKLFYEQRVRFNTTLDISPQEIYDTGIKEVARIKAEMQKIIDDLKFDGDFEAFISFLREDEQFYAKTPQELLSHAAWLSKKAEEILPKYFGHLPRLPFTVEPVPDAIAPSYTTGRYSGGSMDNQKAGSYLVNTYNLPSRPLYVLPSLTLHEAVPGHHLQISLAKEMEDLPDFRSFYLSAFGEGWGLYSEFLGKEAGMYKTAYEDFGRLTYEMWRACRLVVDPGMHYFDMTREEAFEFMRSNTSLSIHEINTEINRYIGWPGQAVSYKIGELKIRNLRTKAEKELGDNFDIRNFHDLILANGSIPLKTLERIVNQYIKETLIDVEKN